MTQDGWNTAVREGRRSAWRWLPLLLLLCATLPHLDQGDYRSDTARYAAVGLQMWRTGDLLTPHLHPAEAYFNKPPLGFWIHGLFLHAFGVSVAAVRAPTVLAAALVLGFAVAIVRRRSGRRVALATGVILALTMEYFRRTREISLDMWQLAFLMAAAWGASKAMHSGRGVWLAAAGVPLGLALLCKPLVGLVAIPVMALCLWGGGHARQIGWLGLTLALALLVAAPWHLAMAHLHGDAFFRQYLGAEVVKRAQGLINRTGPGYYFVEIGRSYWPWMLPLAYAFFRWFRGGLAAHRRYDLAVASLWTVAWLAVLTLFPDKRPRYELPLYPAMAWIAAEGLLLLPGRGLRRWSLRGFRGLAPAAAAAALALALLPVRLQAPPARHWAAALAWARQQAPERVFAGALESNDAARFYLALGWWPAPVRDRSARHRDVPEDALLIYDAQLDQRLPDARPGRFERETARFGPLSIMQLRRGAAK